MYVTWPVRGHVLPPEAGEQATGWGVLRGAGPRQAFRMVMGQGSRRKQAGQAILPEGALPAQEVTRAPRQGIILCDLLGYKVVAGLSEGLGSALLSLPSPCVTLVGSPPMFGT